MKNVTHKYDKNEYITFTTESVQLMALVLKKVDPDSFRMKSRCLSCSPSSMAWQLGFLTIVLAPPLPPIVVGSSLKLVSPAESRELPGLRTSSFRCHQRVCFLFLKYRSSQLMYLEALKRFTKRFGLIKM